MSPFSAILLASRNQAKVLDFGLAKAFDAEAEAEAATATELTQPGGIVGTLSYMSPEQALDKPLDHRSDIFSFGVVLYEMITGRLPFAEGSSQEILNTIVNKNPPSIARYNVKAPDELIRIVNKMLEKDRELRYQLAHEVCADLQSTA
jgi:serine/threonine protein kinase